MRFIERRTATGTPGSRRSWEIYDTHKAAVVATGLRLWDAAKRADVLSALSASPTASPAAA